MPRFHRPRTGDTIIVPDAAAAQYDAHPGWTRVTPPIPDTLKGKALDAALDEAGLPKKGSAEQKRQRLAEHLADRKES